MEHAVYMAKVFHELDPVTPVTIGATFAENMIEMGDAVDVLSFHNYSSTRAQIRASIEKAKQYAAKTGKPLVNSEIGCIARANPYDVTLQEHMQAHVGWYIWELMITGNWGTVHGVFYPDGTVRDPSIAAALLGFFRNRGANVVEDVPDRENHLTEAVTKNRKWLADPNADWKAGLDLAEVSANLLEAAQLAPMHNLPTQASGFCCATVSRTYLPCARRWRDSLPCSSLISFLPAIHAVRDRLVSFDDVPLH